jgi:peroxiredoxin
MVRHSILGPPRRLPVPLDAHTIRHRLVGTVFIGGVTVTSATGERVNLARRSTQVLYFFPGGATSPAYGAETPLADAEEHRAFRDLADEFKAREVLVVGITNQPIANLNDTIAANRLGHVLATALDTELSAARESRLPPARSRRRA